MSSALHAAAVCCWPSAATGLFTGARLAGLKTWPQQQPVTAASACVVKHHSYALPSLSLQGHLVADAAALASASLRKTQSAAGQQPAGPRALMTFSGCPRKLGSTIVLRGSDAGELRRVKRVTAFAAYAAYWGLLESALLSDQLAAAAAAVLPGGGQAEAVAGLADAVASSSFLAAAEARGRQAILSASAHVSVVLERGSPAAEVELPQLEDSSLQRGVNGGGGAAAAWADESSPDSPVSCDSTNMWVVPVEAGTATFTVSGSLSLEEEAAALQQQRQQQRQVQGASTPPARSASWAACDMPPDSPQDPLHQAAKEAALRQLQLTGSEPPSPATAAVDAVSAMEAQPGGSSPPSQQRQQMDAGSGDGESTAAQLARGASAASAQLTAADRDALALVAAAEASGGTCLGPGAFAYRAQQLWLSISCKNPAKGILCEPTHSHCMEFYADTGTQFQHAAGSQQSSYITVFLVPYLCLFTFAPVT